MKYKFIVIFLLFPVLMVAGCGGGRNIKGINEREFPQANLPDHYSVSAAAYNYFVNGSIFEMMGEIQMANRQYAEALKRQPESREIRYAYASTFMNMRLFDQAIIEANKIPDKDVKIWSLMADCYRMLGIKDSSMLAYGQVLDQNRDNIQAYYRLATYYQQDSNIDSALWGFENIARISPSSIVYLQLASLQIQAGNLDKAESSYLESIRQDASEENIRAYLGLATLLESRGEFERAKEYLEKAEDLSPQDLVIKEKLLDFYQEGNDFPRAIDKAHEILQYSPDNTGMARRLAMIYFEADSINQADSIFTVLIDNGEQNLVDFYYSGRIALINEDFGRAKADFAQLTILADSVVDGWLSLGLVYRLQDSVDLELATYSSGMKYVKNGSDSARLLFAEGVTCERHNRFDSAVEAFEKVIGLDPDHSPALNYLGYMLADKGIRLDYARKLIERALEIMPDNAAYLDSYGWVLYRLGDYDQALEQLLKAYQSEKNDPVVTEHIGDVYAAMGDRKNAALYWNLALDLDPENRNLKEKLEQ
nr:tetratricopeptide repeat protein [candidate division Zixibacteria bacterium]